MDNRHPKLHNKIKSGVEDGVFPGAVYAIIKDGQVCVNCVGYRSLYPVKEKNNVDTIYDFASLTKVIVTNTIISIMVEKEIIKYDDKIIKYIPEFIHDDITIFQLLTHSSRLPANVKWWHIKTKDDYLNLILNTKKEETNKWIYSDIGYIILGELIERVMNQPLDQLAKFMIFDKLDMVSATFKPSDISKCAPTEKENNIYVRGYVHDRKARLFQGVAGHAGLFGTIYDLINYSLMVLNNGYYKNKQILSEEAISLWFKQETNIIKDRYRTIGWVGGLNNSLSIEIPNKVIYHSGFTGNRILIDKENNFSFILLSNRVHPSRDNNQLPDFFEEVVTLIYENL